MSRQEYEQIYTAFKASTEANRIITAVSTEIFRELSEKFPTLVVDSIISAFSDVFLTFGTIFKDMAIFDRLTEEEKKALEKEYEFRAKIQEETSTYQDFTNKLIDLLLNEIVSFEDFFLLDNINFERLFASQQLIMLFAHFDAYLSDTVKIVCESEFRKKGIKIMRKKIIEGFINEFNRGPVRNRINSIQSDLKLELKVSKKELLKIFEAEQVRHLFIHNSGKVDISFIRRTKKQGVKKGEIFPLDIKYITEIYEIIRKLVEETNKQILDKFFSE